MLKELPEQILQGLRSLGFTLPYNQDMPPMLSELYLHRVVALDGSNKLALPEINSGLGQPSARTSGMAVPKAAMYKDCLAPPLEHNIRLSRYVGDI